MTNNKPNRPQIMTNEEYHAAPGISSSNLSLLAESPMHLANKECFHRESEAFDFGNLVHCLVLEPDKVFDRYAVPPKLDLRTKIGKADKKKFEQENADKIYIKHDDYLLAGNMTLNVLKIAGGLLTGGSAEKSYFADDDGVIVKCRPDYYIEQAGIVVDIKTTADISEFGLRKSITNYNYHWSAAWYLRVLNILGLPATKFIFVFVEKSQPHMVKVRELTNETLSDANADIEAMMENYRDYLKTGDATMIKRIALFGENYDE